MLLLQFVDMKVVVVAMVLHKEQRDLMAVSFKVISST